MPSHAADLSRLRGRLAAMSDVLRIDEARQRHAELSADAAAPGLWDDPTRAREVTTELARREQEVGRVDGIGATLDDLEVLDELAAEADDEASASEVTDGIARLVTELDRLELATMLPGEHDRADAIVSIHAGEGGVDAMDWAQMLQRMYLRWSEDHGYATEVFDESWGEEAGLKSTTFEVRGADAYGWLSAEHGVHRLVRISPFDSQARRQTSFALVDVVPVLPELDEEVEVAEEDLRVDVYRSSGPGGQSVNTTDSAVRITHLPTGIVVSCQNEKSQHQNKAAALRVLKAKLAELERQRRADQLEELRGGKRNVGFGSQIRSYVLQPYQLVKDLRSEYETGNVQAVLGGDLDDLLGAELRRRARAAH
ncbi:MAG: peptide chain release factor 2 [Nitriliruptoraceae bacterium]